MIVFNVGNKTQCDICESREQGHKGKGGQKKKSTSGEEAKPDVHGTTSPSSIQKPEF